jgi:hypothetical protein
MSGSLPWSSTDRGPRADDSSEVLLRIERNTASLLSWVKVLVVAVILLVALTAALYI